MTNKNVVAVEAADHGRDRHGVLPVMEDAVAAGFGDLHALYKLAKARNPAAQDFFKKRAMNADHYAEFRMAAIASAMTDVTMTKSYLVISSLNADRSFSYFIVGVDDTKGRLFCHRLPSDDRMRLGTDAAVRAAMGFDTECMEPYKVIRVQGDLTMAILGQADTPEELLEGRVLAALRRQIILSGSGRLMEYWRLQRISESAMAGNTRLSDQDFDYLERLFTENGMHNQAKWLRDNHGREVDCNDIYSAVCNLVSNIRCTRELDLLNKRRERIISRIYAGVARAEHRYTFRLGHHTVTLTGTHYGEPYIRQQLFLVLRPSVITLRHREHGKRELMITKPSKISFGLLNRYDSDRDRNELAQTRHEPWALAGERDILWRHFGHGNNEHNLPRLFRHAEMIA